MARQTPQQAGLRGGGGHHFPIEIAAPLEALAHAGQRAGQPRARDRLQQIVGRVDAERVQRVALERGRKHDERPRLGQRRRQRGARALGHLDVEKDDIGMDERDGGARLLRVAGLADDQHVADLGKQLSQSRPRGRLVVDDERFDERGTDIRGHRSVHLRDPRHCISRAPAAS